MTTDSIPNKCKECSKLDSIRNHRHCDLCQHVEFEEEIFCDLNRAVQDGLLERAVSRMVGEGLEDVRVQRGQRERADAAAQFPTHAHIADTIVIAVEAAGMYC